MFEFTASLFSARIIVFALSSFCDSTTSLGGLNENINKMVIANTDTVDTIAGTAADCGGFSHDIVDVFAL